MKRLITVLSSTILFACHLQAQNKSNYDYYLQRDGSGLCNKSLLIFKDSSYCYEGGCEAHSSFSFGKWTQKGNTITFHPTQPEHYIVISKVETSSTSDNRLTVIIYDNKGNNITNRIAAAQFKKNVGYYNMDLDSTATRRTDVKRPNTTIVLRSLQRLLKQKVEIVTDSSNVYKIYLNISGDWNFHANSVWESSTGFSVTKTKTALISLPPYGEVIDGKFKGEEYIKQKE